LIIGAVANGFVWLKIGALLPGQRPSIKDGGLLKLKYENEKILVRFSV